MKKFKLYIHISPSWKYYVGITSLKKIEYRWGKQGQGYKTQYFKRAINKYGWDNFIHILIKDNLSKDEATTLEKLFIKHLKSDNPKYGYNLSKGGEATFLGQHHSEQAKKKISETFSLPVSQYDINGNLIKEWNSMIKAEKELKNVDRSSIAKCCKGVYKTSKGFVWRYKGEPFDKYTLKNAPSPKRKKVKQFSINGELIKIWDSITEAALQLNLSTSTISRCCNGHIGRKTYGGYVWRYINDSFDKYSVYNERHTSIIQYDLNYNYINNYSTIAEASRKTGISPNNICTCCLGNTKTAGGFIWKYTTKNLTINRNR